MTPDALISAQRRGILLCRALLFGLGCLFGAETAVAQDARQDFDIEAQPLAEALETFSTVTGYQILMSDNGAAGTQSNPVKGRLAPHEALAQMISGSGLTVRFTTGTSAVLIPDAARQSHMPGDRRSGATASFEADVQHGVTRILCQDQLTRPGTYRAALDVWIDAAGHVDRAELLGSTGDGRRDERVLAALHSLVLKPPPSDLNQPTTLLFVPMAGQACAGAGAAPRALPPSVMR